MRVTKDKTKKVPEKGVYTSYPYYYNSFFKKGYYYSPHGIVEVIADNNDKKIAIQFIYKNTLHIRKIRKNRTISDKALDKAVSEFLKEVIKN